MTRVGFYHADPEKARRHLETQRKHLFTLGRWMAATDRWEYHGDTCPQCSRRQPGPRCGVGIRLNAEMWETFRAAKEADLESLGAEPDSPS